MTLPCRGWGQGLGFLTAFQPHKRHLHDRSHGVSSQIGNAGGSRRLHGVSLGMAPGREVLSPRENSVRPRRTSETPDALLGSLPCLWASRRPGILKRSYVCYSLVAVSVSSTDFFFFLSILISPNLLVSTQCGGSRNAWAKNFFCSSPLLPVYQLSAAGLFGEFF